jgi:acid phosphatase type 7
MKREPPRRRVPIRLVASALVVGAACLALAARPGGVEGAGDPVIVAAGDIACDPGDGSFNGGNGTATRCRERYTGQLLGGATAVLPLGDNQYEDGAYDKYLQSYETSWGWQKSITRPVAGNHEYRDSAASGYFRYFGAAAGPAGQGWYSYDIGSWHLVALNSECGFVGGCQPGSPEERWLAADLAATRRPCILAYWHRPRFSSGAVHGSDASFDAFWRDLYAARADVVLSAHDHEYERFGLQNPDAQADALGIREFIVGTGGASLYSFSTPLPNSEVRNASTYGVLRLTLHGASYDWQFVPEGGGGFTDSGTTDCHLTPTAASVVSLTSEPSSRGVLVRWRTASEAGLVGFNLYRQTSRLVRLNRRLIAARGNAGGGTYAWLDRAPGAKARYRLEAIELRGRHRWLASTSRG